MDVEKRSARAPYLSGFPSFAAFVASDPDQTTAIFQRFNRLAARHLLHLQSQLAELQAQQDALDREDGYSALNVKQYSRNWAEFNKATISDPRQKRRKDLSEEIGRTLREYRKSLQAKIVWAVTDTTGQVKPCSTKVI